MQMSTQWATESVARCVCTDCGATGPMAKTFAAAQALAILCGWAPYSGRCPHCKCLQSGTKKPAKKK